MAETDSYYEVLGVSREVDAKGIKEAFRRLTLETHPDRSDAPGAEERYRKITEAYAVLSDPDKRAQYDARGSAGVAHFSDEDLVGGIDLADLFGWSGMGGNLFDRFFAGRSRRVRRGAAVELRVRIPLERVAHGGSETLVLEHPRACASCAGTGASPNAPRYACPTCGGNGSLLRTRRRGMAVFRELVTCPDCDGTGHHVDIPCPDCGGRGQVETPRTLELEIPAGLEEGAILEIPGQGLPSPDSGGPAGNLYVLVETEPDPRFARRGADLWRTEALEAPALVLGTQLEVATLDGGVIVKVPPRTSPQSVLRVAGKGLPHMGGPRRGDLKIEVQLDLPLDLTDEETRLYTRLRELAARRAAGESAEDEGALVRVEPDAKPEAAPKKRRWWWPFSWP